MTKRDDRSYFDKWYRDPGHRVSSRMTLELKVRLALATALSATCWMVIRSGWRLKS